MPDFLPLFSTKFRPIANELRNGLRILAPFVKCIINLLIPQYAYPMIKYAPIDVVERTVGTCYGSEVQKGREKRACIMVE